MMSRTAVSTIALVLAGLLFAFSVYMFTWNSDQHPRNSCDSYSRSYHEDSCRAQKEDRNLMLGSGTGALGLLVFGLVLRYTPTRR